jgi:hypothetical protein
MENHFDLFLEQIFRNKKLEDYKSNKANFPCAQAAPYGNVCGEGGSMAPRILNLCTRSKKWWWPVLRDFPAVQRKDGKHQYYVTLTL